MARAGGNRTWRYRPRRPSQSVLYRCVQEHFETWLAHCHEGHDDAGPVPAYVELEFRRCLECGILAYGFARARCGRCGHDFLIAFSCKGRGVCPSCNAWRVSRRRRVDTRRLLRLPAASGSTHAGQSPGFTHDIHTAQQSAVTRNGGLPEIRAATLSSWLWPN